MENTANSEQQPNETNRPGEEATGARAEAPPRASKNGLDSIFCAMRQAAEDARGAAEGAMPKLKSAASDAVYWMAYGVSYAAVFQWTVAKHMAPESLKTGGRDGVKAGREAAQAWVEKRAQPGETPSTVSTIPADPCTG